MNKEGMTEEMKEIYRLLGDNASPVVTPDALAVALGWQQAKIRQMLEERPGDAGQRWARVSDIAKLYRITRGTADSWVCRLREMGKVRMQRPISGSKGKGDMYYNLDDIEKAFEENAHEGLH